MDILWEPQDAEMVLAITLLTGIAFTINVPLQSMDSYANKPRDVKTMTCFFSELMKV